MENFKSTCLHYTVRIIQLELYIIIAYLHKILDSHDVQFQKVFFEVLWR